MYPCATLHIATHQAKPGAGTAGSSKLDSQVAAAARVASAGGAVVKGLTGAVVTRHDQVQTGGKIVHKMDARNADLGDDVQAVLEGVASVLEHAAEVSGLAKAAFGALRCVIHHLVAFHKRDETTQELVKEMGRVAEDLQRLCKLEQHRDGLRRYVLALSQALQSAERVYADAATDGKVASFILASHRKTQVAKITAVFQGVRADGVTDLVMEALKDLVRRRVLCGLAFECDCSHGTPLNAYAPRTGLYRRQGRHAGFDDAGGQGGK
jgi:hypothetical protein